MQYVSPFSLLSNLVDVKSLTDIDIKNEKKRLLLELQLSGGFIRVNNVEFSKNDIIQAFEVFDKVEDLAFHKYIWEEEDLLIYLSSNKKKCYNIVSIVKRLFENGDDKCLTFLSPYLMFKIQKNISLLFKDQEFKELKNRLVIYKFLETNEEGLISNIASQLKFYTDKFYAIENKELVYVPDEFKFFENIHFYYVLNELPEELALIKENLITVLINAINVFPRRNRSNALNIYRGLICVKCDDETKAIIKNNYNFYLDRVVDNSGNGVWRVVGFIAIILVMLGKMSRTCDKDNYVNDSAHISKFVSSISAGYSNDDKLISVLDALKNTGTRTDSTILDSSFYIFSWKENKINNNQNLVIKNSSSLEFRIIHLLLDKVYATDIILPGETFVISYYLNTKYAFYFGNNWSDELIFKNDSILIKGGFSEINKNTSLYLNRIIDFDEYTKRIDVQQDSLGMINLVKKQF